MSCSTKLLFINEKTNQDFIFLIYRFNLLHHICCIGFKKYHKTKEKRSEKYFQCRYLIVHQSYNTLSIISRN